MRDLSPPHRVATCAISVHHIGIATDASAAPHIASPHAPSLSTADQIRSQSQHHLSVRSHSHHTIGARLALIASPSTDTIGSHSHSHETSTILVATHLVLIHAVVHLSARVQDVGLLRIAARTPRRHPCAQPLSSSGIEGSNHRSETAARTQPTP
eukprot:3793874-Rhodomonas_salina.1